MLIVELSGSFLRAKPSRIVEALRANNELWSELKNSSKIQARESQRFEASRGLNFESPLHKKGEIRENKDKMPQNDLKKTKALEYFSIEASTGRSQLFKAFEYTSKLKIWTLFSSKRVTKTEIAWRKLKQNSIGCVSRKNFLIKKDWSAENIESERARKKLFSS